METNTEDTKSKQGSLLPDGESAESGDTGRPNHIPEQFWKDGKLDEQTLLTEYAALSSQKVVDEETAQKDFQEKFAEELTKLASQNRPESPDKYEMPAMPENVSLDEEGLKNNPLFTFWREKAFEAGMNQEVFQEGVSAYIESLQQSLPDIEAEKAKLGDKADDRLNAVSLWARNTFTAQEMPAVQRLGETAEGVAVLERFMKMGRGGNRAPDDGPGLEPMTMADIRQMQNDPRYHDDSKRDPAYVKKVEAAVERLVGSKG